MIHLPVTQLGRGRIESHSRLHLNKRSCIVTNLIGIQRFTRESIVSCHGMVREMTKDTRIEGTSVILMQRSVKAQTGRRYFISYFSLFFPHNFACSFSCFVLKFVRLSSRDLLPHFFLRNCSFFERVSSFAFILSGLFARFLLLQLVTHRLIGYWDILLDFHKYYSPNVRFHRFRSTISNISMHPTNSKNSLYVYYSKKLRKVIRNFLIYSTRIWKHLQSFNVRCYKNYFKYKKINREGRMNKEIEILSDHALTYSTESPQILPK